MRRRFRAVVLPALAAAATAALLPMTAAADTHARIVDAQARLAALNERAEVYAERMNAARDQLAVAQRRADIAERAATTATKRLQISRARVAAFADQAYRSGSFSQDSIIAVTGSSPQEFMDRVTTLEALSRGQAQVLADVAARNRDAEQAIATATAARAQARSTLAKVTAARQAILRDAATAETLLRQLHRKAAAEAAAAAAAALTAQPALTPPPVGVGASAHAAEVAVRWAYSELGKPYVWGAAGPDSFDCSGLTMYVYGKAGIALPHYTGSQWNVGRHVDRSELRPGDLVFYFSDLHHVAIYIGNGQVIHAPHTGDVVRIAPLDMDPYAGAVRVVG